MTNLQRQLAHDIVDVPGSIERDIRQRKAIVPIVEPAEVRDAVGRSIEVPLVKRFRVPAERKGRLWWLAFSGFCSDRRFGAADEQGEREGKDAECVRVPIELHTWYVRRVLASCQASNGTQ